MSHLGTRLIAQAFADPDEGVNSIVQELASVLHGTDPLPDASITVYDDTRHGWVARGMTPTGDMGIDFPCIVVMTMGVDYDSGVAAIQSTGARTVNGTLRVAAQLILQDPETSDAVTAAMYWLRAMRGVIARFDDPKHYDAEAHQFGGIALQPCTSISQGKLDAPPGDTLISPGAFMLTYPILETVPLPMSLH